MKEAIQDFPSGAVDKNPPASAGDMGSNSGPGRFLMLWGKEACAPQLLSPWTKTSEPASLEPVLCNRRSHHSKSIHHNRVAPTRHDWRKPVQSNEDLAQKKKKKRIQKLPAFCRPHYDLS